MSRSSLSDTSQADLLLFLKARSPEYMPTYATPGSAGADIKACLTSPVVIEPLKHALIPTGLHVAIPTGYEIQVRSRSGLALKHQLFVLNSPGTIDSDYRGEIGIILMNMGTEPFIVEPGMRVAQMILAPVIRAQFELTDDLPGSSERASGGFGHTGLH